MGFGDLTSFAKSALLLVLLFWLLLVSLAHAQAPESESDPALERPTQKLIVATKVSPPFAIKQEDGTWTGISIELWEFLANELDLEFEFREASLEKIFTGLETAELDAGVAALSVTAERHERVEFCHPHYTTGLGIAVSAKRSINSWAMLRRLASPTMLRVIGAMFLGIVVCGVLFWIVELRGGNPAFDNKRGGIGLGIWWSTILLIGHKGLVPVSTAGRLLAAGGMITSLLMVSLLTGLFASVLTVQQLDSGITQPGDLRRVRTVTVASSTSADYLEKRRIRFRTQSTAASAVEAIVQNNADAVVYDEALLKYLSLNDYAGEIQILPISFNAQDYAIALPPQSSLRKPLNEALLRFRATDEWDQLIFRYLGD